MNRQLRHICDVAADPCTKFKSARFTAGRSRPSELVAFCSLARNCGGRWIYIIYIYICVCVCVHVKRTAGLLTDDSGQLSGFA